MGNKGCGRPQQLLFPAPSSSHFTPALVQVLLTGYRPRNAGVAWVLFTGGRGISASTPAALPPLPLLSQFLTSLLSARKCFSISYKCFSIGLRWPCLTQGAQLCPVAESIGVGWIYLHVNNTNICTFPLQVTDLAQWPCHECRLCWISVLHGHLTGEQGKALPPLDPQNLLVAEGEQ